MHQKSLDLSEFLISQCLLNIKVPVLLVRGQQTDIVSEEGVKRMLEYCPHVCVYFFIIYLYSCQCISV